MNNRMKELSKAMLTVDFDKLWSGFEKYKYAIYDDKQFYIDDNKGLNLELKKGEFGFIGKVDERFMGNTAISINNKKIAIYDLRTISENIEDKKLSSLLIHEMFHCYQSQYGEKRNANEIFGMEYPIDVDNISLRSRERQHLYNAVFESDEIKKFEHLTEFFNIRNEREKMIGNFINYEKGIETFEGIAVFVEFQALCQLNNEKNKSDLLRNYTKGFTDICIDNLAIRRSSYIQGMLLGMIANDNLSDWKSKFQSSDLYLSDFLMNELKFEVTRIKNNTSPQLEVIDCIKKWESKRDMIFDEFEKSSEKLFIDQNVQITGFDPMNIVKRNNEIIHKSFLRISLDDKEQIIPGPVKTIIGSNVFDVKRIEWLKK